LAPRVTEEYKQVIHEKILDAAQTLFSNKGYHSTSMDDIVKESGLSKGAIYGHFSSKENLFLAVQKRKLASAFNKVEFSPDDTAIEKLKKTLDLFFEDDCQCPRESSVMNLEIFLAAARIESSKADLERHFAEGHRFIQSIIDEGIEKGEFKKGIDSSAITAVLDATIDGLQLRWALGGEYDWSKIKATLIELATQGVLA
jgi:AcrR family transcriptional regulator